MKLKEYIDWVNVSFFCFILPLIVLLANNFKITYNIIFFILLTSYFLSVFILRIFTFYDDYYEVYFPTRFFYRKIKIFYKDLECIRYVVGLKDGPGLQMSKYGHKGFYGMRFEVPCQNIKKTKQLIIFFKEKNIKIIIVNKDYMRKKQKEMFNEMFQK